MPKNIKIIALVGGEEIDVGRCHPGQARIMRKNGLAEWKKDKLVLTQPQNSPEWEPTGIGLREIEPKHGRRLGDSWKQELGDIDPEGILGSAGYPDTRKCQSVDSWLLEMTSRIAAGHEMNVADNPLRLQLGFVDATDNIHFVLPLYKLKSVTNEVLEKYGITKDDLRSTEARAKLLNDPMFGTTLDTQVLAELNEKELEALLMSEVHEEMVDQASDEVLDDLAAAFDAMGANLDED